MEARRCAGPAAAACSQMLGAEGRGVPCQSGGGGGSGHVLGSVFCEPSSDVGMRRAPQTSGQLRLAPAPPPRRAAARQPARPGVPSLGVGCSSGEPFEARHPAWQFVRHPPVWLAQCSRAGGGAAHAVEKGKARRGAARRGAARHQTSALWRIVVFPLGFFPSRRERERGGFTAGSVGGRTVGAGAQWGQASKQACQNKREPELSSGGGGGVRPAPRDAVLPPSNPKPRIGPRPPLRPRPAAALLTGGPGSLWRSLHVARCAVWQAWHRAAAAAAAAATTASCPS